MNYSATYAPGEKTHRDENFPVASYVIGRKYRSAVLAFYRFARAADDVADNPQLTEKEKITRLDLFEATLSGASDAVADALPLRDVIADRNLSTRHPLDLLVAFRQDARKARYKDWDDLMKYCRYSAAPVGRFVLDVHGEDSSVWPASDALCSALQIINHLQDCKADYLRLNRIYIPQNAFAEHKITEIALAEAEASPALRACLTVLTEKTRQLFSPEPLSYQVRDGRLALEVLTIEGVARRLIEVLLSHDPLSERVHLTKSQNFSVFAEAVRGWLRSRLFGKRGSFS